MLILLATCRDFPLTTLVYVLIALALAPCGKEDV